MGTHEHFGQNDARLRQLLDYDNTTAPTDGQAVLWVASAGKFAPRAIVLPSDSRLSDTRTPGDGSVTNAKVAASAAIAESKLALASDAAAGVASRRSLGTGSEQAASGDHAHASPTLFQGRATSNQTLATANAWYSIALQAEDFDTDNAHSTSTNTSRWVSPKSATFRVTGVAFFTFGASITASTVRGVRLAKNGTVISNSSRWSTYDKSEFLTLETTLLVSVDAGDYLEVQATSQLANVQLYGGAADGSLLVVAQVGI